MKPFAIPASAQLSAPLEKKNTHHDSLTLFPLIYSPSDTKTMGHLDEDRLIPRKVKYILTSALYFCYVSLGLSMCLLPAARLDVAELVGSDFEHVTYGQCCCGVGYIAGCLFTGWLFSRINRQIGLVLSLFLTGASMFVIPFLRSLWLYLLSQVVFGFMNSGVDVVCNAWLLEIWQTGANPYMQGMHFCYALGMTLAPLIEEPFLSSEHNVTESYDNATGQFTNGTLIREESRIVIPYSIGSLISVLAAAIILVLHYKVPYTDPRRNMSAPKDVVPRPINNNSESFPTSSTAQLLDDENRDKAKAYQMKIIVLGSLLLCFYTGLELSTFSFITEFAVVIALKLTKSKAAFLSSAMSGSYAVNRLFSIVVASKLRTKTMLYISFVMLSTGNILLLIFANTSEVMLWVAAVIIGLGHASVYPCLISFLEERINVTTAVCSVFMLCSSCTNIFVPMVLGNYVESYPLVYVYINLFGLTACFLIFSVLYVIDRRYRKAVRLMKSFS